MAMHCEAKPFISYLKLKKDINVTKFQIYKNDEIVLILSGTGILASTISTTYLLTQYQAQASDLFFNIGICGTKNEKIKKGTPVLCHKIIHHDTKKTFYPDILFHHPFMEGVLETFSTVVNKEMALEIEGEFVDMEGAGAYQAAAVFLPPHQIHCIKIVSDFLDNNPLTQKEVSEIIQQNVLLISTWMNERSKVLSLSSSTFTEEEEKLLDEIRKNLRLTVTMNYQLKQLAKQYKIRCGNLFDAIKPFLAIKCNSKKERKIYFADLKKRLMEI